MHSTCLKQPPASAWLAASLLLSFLRPQLGPRPRSPTPSHSYFVIVVALLTSAYGETQTVQLF